MNNFLSIVWYRVLPPHYGGQKGIALFNYHLGKKILLTCLCSRNNFADESLPYKVMNELPRSKFQFWNPIVRRKILSLIRKQRFTHILIEHPWHGWLGTYKSKYGFTFIVHAHNIEHLRLKGRNKLWWRFLKKTEEKAFTLADHILFKTENDKKTAVSLFRLSPEKCLIVPYGIRENEQFVINTEIKDLLRKKYTIAPDEKLILFAGTLDYGPNARALEVITDHIIPLLQKKAFRFRLLICGGLPGNKMSALNAIRGVSAVGFVSAIQDYMQLADVFINPVVDGSGIQTKNIEAIANGCNVVTTSFAATGLPRYLDQKKLFVSANHDWVAFAENIIIACSFIHITPQQFYLDYHWQNIINRMLLRIVSKG